MNKENLIGKEIGIDKNAIDRAIKEAQKAAESANMVVKEFNRLETLGKFTQKTWEGIKKDNGATIIAAYQKKVSSDLKNFSIKSIKDRFAAEAETEIKPLMNALEDLAGQFIEGEPVRLYLVAIKVDKEDVIFKDGKFIANIKRIKSKGALTISNETEARVYAIGTQVEPLINEMLDILNSKGNEMWRRGLNEIFPKSPISESRIKFESSVSKWEK